MIFLFRVNSGVGLRLMFLLPPSLRFGCPQVSQQVGGWCPSRRSQFVSAGRRLNPCRAVTVRVYVVRTLLDLLHRG